MDRDVKDAPDRNCEPGQGGARAILRVPEILFEVALHPKGVSHAELAERLTIPRASLHRMLLTLAAGGYLTRDGGRFALGSASFALASRMAAAGALPDLVSLALPELERLAVASGETVMLGQLAADGDEVVYRAVVDSEAPVRFTVAVGERRSLHCAASGLATLAYLPASDLHDWIRRSKFEPITPQTVKGDELEGRLQAIRETGVAFDDGGNAIGAAAIAVPVFSAEGALAATISIAGPSERISARRQQLDAFAKNSAERVSRILGFAGDYRVPDLADVWAGEL